MQITPDSPSGCWPLVKHWDRVVRLQGPHNIFCECENPFLLPFDWKENAGERQVLLASLTQLTNEDSKDDPARLGN